MDNYAKKGLEEEIDALLKEENFANEARKRYYTFIDDISNGRYDSKEIQMIYSLIDEMVFEEGKEQFIKNLEKGEVLYRARIVNPENDLAGKGISKKDGCFSGFDDINSREPIVGISGHGRNNYKGASYLYVASNEQTACMEVKPRFSDLISVAEFRVKRDLKLVNFNEEKAFENKLSEKYGLSLSVFFSHFMSRFSEPIGSETDYRVTQIIADYIRKTGIDGISYRSFLCPKGVNYTVFNSHPQNIEFVNSRLVSCRQADYCFWDWNEEKEIHSNPEHKKMGFNKKDMWTIKTNFEIQLNDENNNSKEKQKE